MTRCAPPGAAGRFPPRRLTRARITLQWLLAGKPVPAPPVVKQRTVIGYQRRYRLRTFVETGTYTGEMVQAMNGHVEPDHLHRGRAVAPRAGCRRVSPASGTFDCCRATAPTLLPAVLATLDGPALFWLDGHYMGGESGRGTEDTPVMAEMAALLGHTMRGHVVLIDDARLFDGTGGYPRLHEFTAWVKTQRPGTDVTIDGDIIRCVFDAEGHG